MAKKAEALRERLLAEAKAKVKEKLSARDLHLVKAVAVLEDLDKSFNLLAEQAISWYGVHFPELEKLVKGNESYLKLVSLGERKNFSREKVLEKYDLEEGAAKIAASAKQSVGAEIKADDLKQIQSLAETALALKELRKQLTSFLEKGMAEVAPNFSKVCGAVLGAKLLAQAGSLEKLAMLPSSTIQLLGAEKALFRHIKAGVKPPKYGFLFQHPLVKQARRDVKGKLARTLAAKLSLAAREDFYGKEMIADKLIADLERRAAEFKKK